MIDVLAYWRGLHADKALTKHDRIVGAACARRGNVPGSTELVKMIGNPKINEKAVSAALRRLTDGGHLAGLAVAPVRAPRGPRRPARAPRPSQAATS